MSSQKSTKSLNGTTTSRKNQDFNSNRFQPSAGSPIDVALRRAMRQVASGKYEQAIDLLRSDLRDARVRNACGVCLMRLGSFDAAIRMLRELVLKPGCTWMRPEAPKLYKINYATALLLGGHPDGCRDMLAEINDPSHPSVARLQGAVNRWVSSLSFWQKMNWWLYGTMPANRPVTVDYLPGEFDVEISPTSPPNPAPAGPNLKTAA